MMSDNSSAIRKALVVDDNDGNRDVLGVLLTQLGYQVYSATDGQAGIAAADLPAQTGSAFALAFVDMRLPDVFGAEVIAAVRRAGSDTFIIAATMDDDPKTMHAAYDAGCDMFLVKPYDIEQVMQIVRQAQRGRHWIADQFGLREYTRR
jgi:CheY-like chemotaxis protein